MKSDIWPNQYNAVNSSMNVKVIKRKLREQKNIIDWAKATVEERLDAVETINCLKEKKYAEQAFLRVFKITRKTHR
ncbi:MAG: hypothetical protein ACLFQM_10260 [Fidelibacterota bacterium]